MAPADDQASLFDDVLGAEPGVVIINSRCQLRTHAGMRAVFVAGLPLLPFPVGDRLGEGYAMVSLVEQGWASQVEVARAFECSTRTVRRQQRRFEDGGLAALGRPVGYPRGRPRLADSLLAQVREWLSEGVPHREIARRRGVTDGAVRKLACRLGFERRIDHQEALFEGAYPNLSGLSGAAPGASAAAAQDQSESQAAAEKGSDLGKFEGAYLNLSGVGVASEGPGSPSFDVDPSDRSGDRVLASLGLLDDAAPMFRSGDQVPGAGVLLAVPAIVESGVLDIGREVYGSIGPAFYGLRTSLVTFLFMALLRIKRPEGLKERSPVDLGRLLGLDRAPEVKTARRKIERMAALGRAASFGRALARRRVETRGHALGFLYVDGHVRVYHGKRKLPKTHVARMRISLPATTDYWINDATGEPLFVVSTEANQGLVKMLPGILDEVRRLVGERRITIVFDRGGYSPKLFKQLIAAGFDILTYRKGRFKKVPRASFVEHKAVIDGRPVSYLLADQNVLLDKRSLKLRQVTRLSDEHQTPILTSRTDLSAIEVAQRMFDRWRQDYADSGIIRIGYFGRHIHHRSTRMNSAGVCP